MSSEKKLYKFVLSAMFLALALVLPFLTGQIPEIGNMMCPMHIPVILCGFFCGPWYALCIGIIAPLLRFTLFSFPVLMPSGISMCAELAVYGAVSGLLYKYLPKKKIYIYVSLLTSMIAGRIVWGLTRLSLYGFLGKYKFTWTAFWLGAFANAIPGIAVQIILIPALVMILDGHFTHRKLKGR